ncbi:MAG: methionyl-tRNA formyltransferase [Gammaproteobacteria bacterium]|nr:methionyl-tRNA formyltransferase [Gammaproteobacteria bacterium]MBT8436833.1 methionyl-tRNA formyltransferase [Gammaproteobacteria bacterium]
MLRIIYAGTPEFAVPALESLQRSEHRLVAVYSQPDRPAGRGRKMQQSPVKKFALAHDLPVFQPTSFGEGSAVEDLRALNADLMVVAAYGLLLPPVVLEAPRLGCINIHASLLPRWRGASPIQQAILAGDETSGVTLMKMDQGLDTGAMIASRSIVIDPTWNASDLHDSLSPLGAGLLLESLDNIEQALQQAQVQDESLATYAPRLTKQQAEVDWNKPVQTLLREIRAFNPWPVSYTFLDDDRLRLWSARINTDVEPGLPGHVAAHDTDGVYISCGKGVLQLTELQFAGRNKCSAAQALNARNLSGCSLGKP